MADGSHLKTAEMQYICSRLADLRTMLNAYRFPQIDGRHLEN